MTTPAPKMDHLQSVEGLCAATMRAIAADAGLNFRGHRLHQGLSPYRVLAPHVHPSLDQDDFACFRGASDSLALRRLHSDMDLHRRLSPSGPVAALVFDMLEQFRVEGLAPESRLGLVANLHHRFRAWSAAFRRSGLTESRSGLLLYTVALVCRSRVTAEPVEGESDDVIEALRFELAPIIGVHLERLRRARTDQAEYAAPARAIAEHVNGLVLHDKPDEDGDRRSRPVATFSLFTGHDDPDDPSPSMTSQESWGSRHDNEGYRIFTGRYDREEAARDLFAPEVLRTLRARLDGDVMAQGVNVYRLAAELRAGLASPLMEGWSSGHQEGLIDGRRLTQLVTSASERRLFRQRQLKRRPDAVVTFLMDCSGSMRQHTPALTVVLDLLLRALDVADVTSELLGFTTASWNGGRARRDWERAGSEERPGRLNERRHLVFKAAGSSWRRARPDIAALLRDDLYREGIDGEAVLWAAERLRNRTERHRLLLVISDGSPLDSATVRLNGDRYLDDHLRQVVRELEAAGGIHVAGLGVGRDLSSFYSTSLTLNSEKLTDARLCRDMVRLLSRIVCRAYSPLRDHPITSVPPRSELILGTTG